MTLRFDWTDDYFWLPFFCMTLRLDLTDDYFWLPFFCMTLRLDLTDDYFWLPFFCMTLRLDLTTDYHCLTCFSLFSLGVAEFPIVWPWGYIWLLTIFAWPALVCSRLASLSFLSYSASCSLNSASISAFCSTSTEKSIKNYHVCSSVTTYKINNVTVL